MRDWLDPKAPAIARAFQQAGYATAHVGKWHMGGGRDVGDAPLPSAYGFDETFTSFEGLGDRVLWSDNLSQMSEKLGRGNIVHESKTETSRLFVDRAVDFVRRNRARPFYLQLTRISRIDRESLGVRHEPRLATADVGRSGSVEPDAAVRLAG